MLYTSWQNKIFLGSQVLLITSYKPSILLKKAWILKVINKINSDFWKMLFVEHLHQKFYGWLMTPKAIFQKLNKNAWNKCIYIIIDNHFP